MLRIPDKPDSKQEAMIDSAWTKLVNMLRIPEARPPDKIHLAVLAIVLKSI